MFVVNGISTPRRHGLLAGLVAGGLIVAFCLAGATLAQEKPANDAKPQTAERGGEPVKRIGRAMKLRLPITGKTYPAVRRFVLRALDEAKAAGTRPVLIFTFDVAPDARDFAASSEFGASYQLADFLSSDKLNDATTVAYIPESIQGHAVLVALACEQIIMGPSAEIGSAAIHEPTITPPLRSAYKEIASRRKTIPTEVALGLLEPARKVLVVETDLSREYVTPEQLEELRKTRTIQSSRTLFEAGQPGRLSADEARGLDLISAQGGQSPRVGPRLGAAPGCGRRRPVGRRPVAGGAGRPEGTDHGRDGQTRAAVDRRRHSSAPGELHLPVDRKPGRVADRQR